MRLLDVATAAIAVLATTALGEEQAQKVDIRTFKSKPAREAVKRYLDKTASYEARLEELNVKGPRNPQ